MNGSRRTALLLGVSALILSLAAWASGRQGANVRVEVTSARRELAKAVGAVRLLEGRLTGGFTYARFVPKGVRAENSRELKEARARIERAFSREGSPQSFADAGVLNLLGDQPDKAIALLERATKRGSADAGIWSDLAAAYLARFDDSRKFTDLLDAFEAADRAVKAAPELPEAQFNFALVLDHLSLRFRARTAWPRYIDLDGGSGWSREAEERFSALFQPNYADSWANHRTAFEQTGPDDIEASARKLVQLFPQQARELVEEDLLGRWAVGQTQGRLAEAERALVLAWNVGTALAARGEKMSAESVLVVRVASADLGGAPILKRLVEGHTQYQKGLVQSRLLSFGSAGPLFEAARKALAEAGSPFELWAQFQLAVCDTQLFHYESALHRLENLLRSRDITLYPALRARALWVAGLVYGYRGAPAETLAAYREALEIFGRLGEKENLAVVSNLLAEMHRHLGDLPGAWGFHRLALEGLRSISNTNKRLPIFAELGVSLLADNRAQVSIYVQEERLRSYAGTLNPGLMAGGLRRMAEAQYCNGNFNKALALIRQAKREADRVTETRVREGLFGDLLTLEGRIEAEVDPQRAVRLLSAAIVSDERSQNRLRLVGSLLERARALRWERNFGPAEASLRRAMQLLQNYRPAEDLVAASFEQVRQVFGEMLHLQILQERPAKALEFAERGRAQLLSLMAPVDIPAIPVLTLEQIQKELPQDVALVEWWIGEREIFSWTVRRDSFSFALVPMNNERLHRATLKFRKAISSDDVVTARSVAAWLHTALLAPIESSLGGADRLVLVSDRTLSALPFAALQRSTGAPYLIEERIFSVAPSASLYVHCLRRERELAGIELSVVAFGNPSFDRSFFHDLAALPHSEAEAEQIVGVYTRGKVILGPEVTGVRMLNEIANWPVLHIGSHAVVNPINPFTSALALAPSRGDNGVLYFRDLTQVRLTQTRLAFLSACSTLRGNSAAGAEIGVSLLFQGTPAVVGTLWPVGDGEAQELAVDFHRRFVKSRDAASALREAQLAIVRSKSRNRTSVWAGFELVGSG